MKFEWDPEKERRNIQKHGVTFEEAAYVFSDPFALSRFDEEHSGEEERYVLLGKTKYDKLVIVIHTFRDASGMETVRIISARKATKRESGFYEKRCRR